MVTLKQIAKAINDKLTEVLPYVSIQSKDISEGYSRPCFYVDFDHVTTGTWGIRGRERTIEVIIYYFPKDRHQHKIEILEVQEILEGAFTGCLPVTNGFVIEPFEVNSIKVDGVLQFSFELYTAELSDSGEHEGPDMLELNLELKERD